MVKRTLVAWFVASALLLSAGLFPAVAQEAEAGFRLSLANCLKLALDNNLDLVSARIDPQVSEENLTIQKAAFDPTFTAQASRFEAAQETTNISQVSGLRRNDFSAKLEQTLNFGASFTTELTSGQQDRDIPAGNIFFQTPTEFNTNLRLDFRLPLLRGLGKEVAAEQLMLARQDLDISREELRRQAHVTIEIVEGAYWDVAASRRALEVARARLARAQDLLDLNRKKVEVGTMAPIEITQAEAGVADTEESVIVAETNLANAEDELRRLMAIPPGDPMWLEPILTDTPSFEPLTIDLDDAIETALAERPELSNANSNLSKRELSVRSARKRRWHQLDFNVNFTPSGTDVDVFDGMGVKLSDATLIDALEEIPDLDNRSWTAALIYSFPISNRSAKADHRIAQLNLEKSQIELRNQEQTIQVEVRRAVRNVDSGIKRVRAARENVRLQTEKLNAEQKKFDNGMSTSFEVLTFQNDLADAELRMIQAAVDYTKALAALEVAKGTLLQARGLALAP